MSTHITGSLRLIAKHCKNRNEFRENLMFNNHKKIATHAPISEFSIRASVSASLKVYICRCEELETESKKDGGRKEGGIEGERKRAQ